MIDRNVLGVQLYTLREFCKTAGDFAETLKKVRQIGYTAIQISGIGPIDEAEVATIVADNGLTVAGTHMGWSDFVSNTDKVINKHKLWKCNHAAVGMLPAEYYTQAGMKKFIDELASVAPKLATEGIDFSYHNHCVEFVKYDGKVMLEELYEKASPQMLKAELDTYWIQAGGGNPEAFIRKIGPRQPLLHLKDFGMAEGEWQPRTVEIGQGNLNWPEILKAAEEVQAEWYLVEQDNTYGRDPFESVKISYDYLKSLGLS